jgi:acyl dehydratase
MYDAKLPEEHKKIPLWGCEDIYWEEFEIGHQVRTIRRTISEGESMQFNTLMCDIHPYVADEIFAREEGLFGRRLVAGAFVFSAGIGLVATNWLQAFSYGYDRLRFIKPVFIGDTIYTVRTNIAKDPKYEDRGLTRAKYEVFKEEGEIVLYCEHLQTVLYRDPVTARKEAATKG